MRLKMCAVRTFHEIEKRVARVIRRGSLESVAEPGAQDEQEEDRRCAGNEAAQPQMDINISEDNVVHHAVEDPAAPALTVRQAGELAIGVVQRIGTDMEEHSDKIQPEVAIVIEMSRR